VTNLERSETRRYLEMFYGLQLRPLAAAMAPA
jgi:sucrose synthase